MRKVDEIIDLVFREAFQRYRVELDRKTGRPRRLDPFESAGERSAARDHRKFVGVDRVQRHIDPPHAQCTELLRVARQLGAVGRERELPQPTVGQIRESPRNSCMISFRTSGSPPVTRIFSTPHSMKAQAMRSSSSNVSSSLPGRKLHRL